MADVDREPQQDDEQRGTNQTRQGGQPQASNQNRPDGGNPGVGHSTGHTTRGGDQVSDGRVTGDRAGSDRKETGNNSRQRDQGSQQAGNRRQSAEDTSDRSGQ